MALPAHERERLARLDIPGSRETRSAVRDYMARADLAVSDFAERIGYAESSLEHFLHGTYCRVASNDEAIRAAACEYMERCPLAPRQAARGRLFETENVRRMRGYFTAAVERGEISMIYGPPGTQKTFTLQHLIAECNRAGHNDALYVYASVEMTPLSLLKRIGREAGVRIGFTVRERITVNILDAFFVRPKPPAIVVDEAQHLTIGALEAARELHDRAGCGIVLAGSHDLFEKFLRSRQQLEQWLSRIDYDEPLPGLLEPEVREIAMRELGNGQPARLTRKQLRALLEGCLVDDVFARGPDGKPAPRQYISVRRLVKIIAQYKARKGRAA